MVVRGVVLGAGDPVVVAVAEGGVVGLEPVLDRLGLDLKNLIQWRLFDAKSDKTIGYSRKWML